MIIDYWDFGLAYKQLKGREESEGSFARGDSIGQWFSEGDFNDQHLTLAINANKLFCVRDYRFFQFSLGANVDWRFGEGRDFEGFFVPDSQDFPPEFIGQGEKVLIIDDFLASGATIQGLVRLTQAAGAELVGIGTLIEKTFEGGREALAYLGVQVEALVSITSMADGQIVVAP